ncbi:F-box protein [Chlorella vulgaris]
MVDNYPTSEVWLGSLLTDITVHDIKAALSSYGIVHFCHIGQHAGMRMAYAKLTMGSVEEAASVVSALNNAVVPELSGTHQLKVHFARVGATVPPSPHSPVPANARLANPGARHSPSSSSGGTFAPSTAANGGAARQRSGTSSVSQPTGKASASASAACCGSCGKPESASVVLRRCGACKAIAYCGTACQHADWTAQHSSECGVLQQLARLLAANSGVAATLRAAVQQPRSGLNAAVQGLLAAKLAALEEDAAAQQQPQPQQQTHGVQQPAGNRTAGQGGTADVAAAQVKPAPVAAAAAAPAASAVADATVNAATSAGHPTEEKEQREELGEPADIVKEAAIIQAVAEQAEEVQDEVQEASGGSLTAEEPQPAIVARAAADRQPNIAALEAEEQQLAVATLAAKEPQPDAAVLALTALTSPVALPAADAALDTALYLGAAVASEVAVEAPVQNSSVPEMSAALEPGLAAPHADAEAVRQLVQAALHTATITSAEQAGEPKAPEAAQEIEAAKQLAQAAFRSAPLQLAEQGAEGRHAAQ